MKNVGRILRDSGWSRQVTQLLKKHTVTVGIHSDDSLRPSENEDDKTNAEIGFKHEYGLNGMPQRSFLRSTYDERIELFKRVLSKAIAHSAKTGIRPTQALEIAGLKIVADVKAKIRSRIAPPNSPATVARKKSATPLIDTGQLLNSIDYEVK